MTPETTKFILGFAIGLIVGVVFIGEAIVWYLNHIEDSK